MAGVVNYGPLCLTSSPPTTTVFIFSRSSNILCVFITNNNTRIAYHLGIILMINTMENEGNHASFAEQKLKFSTSRLVSRTVYTLNMPV